MKGSSHAKNQLDSFIRFDRTPTCDRQTQTDRQTERQTEDLCLQSWLVAALAKRRADRRLLVKDKNGETAEFGNFPVSHFQSCTLVHLVLPFSLSLFRSRIFGISVNPLDRIKFAVSCCPTAEESLIVSPNVLLHYY